MNIVQSYQEGLLKLEIDGDLDAGSAIAVDRVIKDAFDQSRYQILIDCKQLNYISSAGLGVFISHLEDFSTNQGSFVFYDMNERVYSSFELLGLHNIFKIARNEHEAKGFLSNHEN